MGPEASPPARWVCQQCRPLAGAGCDGARRPGASDRRGFPGLLPSLSEVPSRGFLGSVWSEIWKQVCPGKGERLTPLGASLSWSLRVSRVKEGGRDRDGILCPGHPGVLAPKPSMHIPHSQKEELRGI